MSAKKKSGITLVEIMIVCIVVSISVGLVTAGLRTLVERERQQVCAYNELILYKAMQLYAADHDVYPSSLSILVPEYATQALALLKKENMNPPKAIAMHIIQFFAPREAIAQNFSNYYGGDIRIITCPSDTTPPSSGGVSYGLDTAVAGQNPSTIAGEPVIIADVDQATYANVATLAHRHRNLTIIGAQRNFAIGTTIKGRRRINRKNTSTWRDWDWR